ncbi:Endoplasmic reticulum protein EP58, contains filamin rod domain and KDEL motif [Phaffia rhodozyma]|uniref:Endoplasmic reticulum protein EP58, contains filamin rod domain and KDEL motif n=1 Tax=Phaffia rhodozyma TaxID=264483 RepID=A0A0F7SKB6_PHARH|nr:Endoplasmic reticulum protein EP58, contains filamin rod domain and KDEL motif [Phaffia rhodozyma]
MGAFPSRFVKPTSVLARRPIFFCIVIFISLSIIYPIIHLGPLEVFYYAFTPAIQPESDIHPSYASSINLPLKSQLGKKEHLIVNGLLEVNKNLSATNHPIYQLVRSAKKDWVKKNERQSTTLAQAVKEYKRRHGGRNPPKGFDRWWDFVVQNNVPLPDEYDRIMVDLGPFRGFSPSTLRSRVKDLQKVHGTFSLKNVGGVLTIHSINYDRAVAGADARAQGQLDFIKNIAHHIPDFDACFSIEDTPTQFVSWSHLQELKSLDEEGEYFDPDDEADRAFSDWGSACPPHTPLWRQSVDEALHPTYNYTSPKEQYVDDPNVILSPGFRRPHFKPEDLQAPPPPEMGAPKSFIADHTQSMDLCTHNSSIRLHGTMNGLHPVPASHLMPIFSLSKTNLHSDILVIPIEQWGEDAGALHWNEKESSRVLWRGRNTGGMSSNHTPWRSSHRPRLARMGSYDLETTVEIIPSPKWIEANKFVPHPLAPPPEAQADDQSDGSLPTTTPEFDLPTGVNDDEAVGSSTISDDDGRKAEAAQEAADSERRSLVRRQDEETHEDDIRTLNQVILEVNQGELNKAMLDIGLAYKAIQCDREDGTCDDIEREITFRDVKTFSQENHYKYILDIDGNAWSARFKRLLNSNALIIKSTIFPEWWNDRIQPWLHYVPLKVDFSDLYDIMTFFHGDGQEFIGEELMARAIAENGRAWSLSSWRREDMIVSNLEALDVASRPFLYYNVLLMDSPIFGSSGRWAPRLYLLPSSSLFAVNSSCSA